MDKDCLRFTKKTKKKKSRTEHSTIKGHGFNCRHSWALRTSSITSRRGEDSKCMEQLMNYALGLRLSSVQAQFRRRMKEWGSKRRVLTSFKEAATTIVPANISSKGKNFRNHSTQLPSTIADCQSNKAKYRSRSSIVATNTAITP